MRRGLDLFCKAGGASKGYHDAGFAMVGVDFEPQPRYPYCFVQMGAGRVLRILMTGGYIECQHGHHYRLSDLDFIHAAPPCQGYSRLRHLPWLKDKRWPLLIPAVRQRLQAAGLPYVIENVEDAPLVGFTLCGTMFGLPLYRHRKFETNWFALVPAHPRHEVVIGHGRMLNDRRKGTLNAGSNKGAWGNQTIVTVAGGQFRKADGERAMGIDWMLKPELAQASPPAMTRYIGMHLLTAVAPEPEKGMLFS